MTDNNLRTHPAGTAKSDETAIPAQEKERDEAERAYLEELVERAVEAKLHNHPLPGRRRFSKRAYKLAREAFKAAAWKVVDGLCPQLRLNGTDLRRLAKLRIGDDIPEGTISSDIALLNDLADTEEGRVGFLSPFINTARGPRQVRLFLLSERTDHFFSFEILDERGKVLVKRITAEVEPGQTFEDMIVAEALRSSRVKLRFIQALKISAAVLAACILTYAVLPEEAQAAIRKFAREKIVEPVKQLFGGDGTPAGSNVDVSIGRDIPNAQIVEERARLRQTPTMYWSYGSMSNSGAICDGNTAVNLVSFGPPSLDPPFVIVRNNVIIRDNIMVKKVDFEDRDLEPGKSYTYTLGKRDPATGEVLVGRFVGTTAPRCPRPSPAENRPPALALTVDRATGPAPLRATFNVSVFDDEERVRPFVFDFGDGTYMLASKSPRVTHEYRYGGTYTAKVSLSDRSNQGAQGLTTITVEGPPRPPVTPGAQDPWEQWNTGSYFAKASPVVGYVDDPFTIEIFPEYIVRDLSVPVAAYYWSFEDCYGAPPAAGATKKDNTTNCLIGPFKEPRITRRFDKPGTYAVEVYIVYEDGGTSSYRLGHVTAIPSERWLATHPVDAHARMHYDQMIEAARYYPSRVP